MKAAVKRNPAPGISIETISDPIRRPGEALVRIDTNGICGSDIHAYEWIPEYAWMESLLPVVMGHEMTGTILEKDPEGIDNQLATGDRVAIRPAVTCGSCEECQRGTTQRCNQRNRMGWERDGGMAGLISVPKANLYAIPRGVDSESASLTEPLTVVLHALSQAPVRDGSKAAVVGAGAIGLLALQVLKHRGFSDIVLIGTDSDQSGGGFDIARGFEATAVLDGSAEMTSLNGSYDLVFVAAGAKAAVRNALALCAQGGTVVVVGLGIGAFEMDMDIAVRRELSVIGAFGSVAADWLDAIELLRTGAVTGAGIVSHHFELEDTEQAFKTLSAGRARKVCVYPNGREDSK